MQDKDRCCMVCGNKENDKVSELKSIKFKQCWRRLMRETIQGRVEFATCKWSRYIMHFLETHKEEISEK